MKIYFYDLRPYDELPAAEKICREMDIEFAHCEEYPDLENYIWAKGYDAISTTPCGTLETPQSSTVSIGMRSDSTPSSAPCGRR